MFLTETVVLSLVAAVVYGERKFPPHFQFGAASSAYQMEGAWNISDKSESIWDRFTHAHSDRILDQTNGDVACDSYHHWREDLQMASEIGLHHYRLSIAWTRLLPRGLANYVSRDGTRYYNEVLNELLSKGIEPMVTLYHWDLPQRLQDLGGWTNPLIVEWFAEYAAVVFSLFGDRVKMWITINEPLLMCDHAYSTGGLAPGLTDPDMAVSLCTKHVLLAHAKAWRIYDEHYKDKYGGKVAISNQLFWVEPETPDQEELADLIRQSSIGRFSHPIYSEEGGWPPSLEQYLKERGEKDPMNNSRLPHLTDEEIKLIRGTYDYYAMNHYFGCFIRKAKEDEPIGTWPFAGAPQLDAVYLQRPDLKLFCCDRVYIYPEGIRQLLLWLRRQYGDITIFITENGYGSMDDRVDDQERIQYHHDHLEQVLLAIEDGVNVRGYTVWSLMDNFEWGTGHQTKFGLYQVDFQDPERRRTPRSSALYYANVIRTHSLIRPSVTDREEL